MTTEGRSADAKQEFVLDDHGELIWEDVLDDDGNPVYEDLYQIRYLLPDGTIITKSEYDTKIKHAQEVYKAVFVGCSYHCG